MTPDFLQPAHPKAAEAQELPSFLVPGQPPAQPLNQSPNPQATKDLIEMQNNILFETVLERVASGISLTETLRTDVRQPDVGAFLRWIHRDSKRKQRYYEAQEIGGEIVADEMISIADATNSLEDVQRSTLRINTRKFLLSVWNKKRFGETKQIEINQSISITDALAAANSRMSEIIEGEVIEELPKSTRLISHNDSNEDID